MRPLLEFYWLWIFLWIKLSWHSCSIWDKHGWLNWLWQFLCERLSYFNPKGFYHSLAWSCSLSEGRLHMTKLGNSADSYLCVWLGLLHWVLLLFPLSITFFVFMCGFYSTSSNIMFSRSTHLLMFIFGDFNVHHKDWLTYSGKTDRPGELSYNFLSQTTLLRWLTLLLGSLTVVLTVLVLWISCFLLRLVFIKQWLSLHWKILIMLLSQFPLTFHWTHNGMPRFIT